MASELKVDKFTGVTTAGSIDVTGEGNSTTTNLQQGLTKAWVNFNGTGTVAIQDSFNVSGLTDNGTGDYTVVISNDMANASYSYQATASNWETGNNADSYMGVSGYHGGQATTSQRIITYRERYDVTTPTAKDPLTTTLSVNGDLA